MRLELICGLDTPAAYADERMQYRVKHLSDSLTARGIPDSLPQDWTDALPLIMDWYRYPEPDDAGLQQRFGHVLTALRARAGAG
ncbi:MAG: hypothetical protein R3202_04550 [Candidatus Competibacterales bacterium]|nr:hypothetical protein [Candidatus Competibacterales bacterium]